MNIELIRKLARKPDLYEKGTSVMWTDPYIAKQLLNLHINPDCDIASRSRNKIEITIEWILEKTDKQKLKILDLGCGPGLYAELLTQKGHQVTGIDFSENSIQYAIKQAQEKQLNIEYIRGNYLDIDFKEQYDLIILIYADFCVLIPDERKIVLDNICRALKKDGLFIFDVVNQKNIDKKLAVQSWDIQNSGFWRNIPYIVLSNGYHYPEAKALATHHIVVDDNKAESYIFWINYYEENDLVPVLFSRGFYSIKSYENVLPGNDCWDGENITFYVAKKK